VVNCEVFAQVSKAIWDFVCQYQNRLVVDRDEQKRFAKRGGFCPFHTWGYESVASPYGSCNGYPNLLDRLSDELHAAASTSANNAEPFVLRLQNLLATQDDCVLCVVRDNAENEDIGIAARRIDEGQGRTPPLSAVCLPHLVKLVAAMENERAIRDLLEHEAAVLRRFSEDMRRFALKQDAVRRYMASQEELTVAERGLLAVAGFRRVNFLPGRTGVPRCEDMSRVSSQ
jgi:hypothetical protein